MASSDCGRILKSTGSETASAPFGMTVDELPLKVKFCRVFGWIADTPDEPLNGRAIVTAVMGRGETPKALEIRRRIVEAPIDICKVWRIVVSTKVTLVPFCSCQRDSSSSSHCTHEWWKGKVGILGQLRHGRPGINPMTISEVEPRAIGACCENRGKNQGTDGQHGARKQHRDV